MGMETKRNSFVLLLQFLLLFENHMDYDKWWWWDRQYIRQLIVDQIKYLSRCIKGFAKSLSIHQSLGDYFSLMGDRCTFLVKTDQCLSVLRKKKKNEKNGTFDYYIINMVLNVAHP